jgi:hypothetical protein
MMRMMKVKMMMIVIIVLNNLIKKRINSYNINNKNKLINISMTSLKSNKYIGTVIKKLLRKMKKIKKIFMIFIRLVLHYQVNNNN